MFNTKDLSEEESKRLLKQAGIIDEDGNLKEPYGDIIDTVKPSTVLEYIDDTLNMLGKNFDSRNIVFIEDNVREMRELFVKEYLKKTNK